MTYAIAAAGTGGHVYPGLAVAEALMAAGVDRSKIVFFGGDRMEATTVPAAGFELTQLELRGLKRSFSPSNLSLPFVVWRAVRRTRNEIEARGISAMLCMGGYVTVPVAYAAKRSGIRLLIHEQNARAGLANRIAARWAEKVFVSFPGTQGLEGEVVGNPLRAEIAEFDRSGLAVEAAQRYDLDIDVPTIGVFGGSLGAAAINHAVSTMLETWSDGPIQIVHLVGSLHEDAVSTARDPAEVTRRIVGFEDRMDLFYAASDLVIARGGGSVYEVAATQTPSIVIPGSFGHQAENAAAIARAGAGVIVAEASLDQLGSTVSGLIRDSDRLARMAEAASEMARPAAANVVADAIMGDRNA